MNLIQFISNYIHDQSNQNRVYASIGTLFTLYSLFKIETKIRSLIDYFIINSQYILLFALVLVFLAYFTKRREQINWNRIRVVLNENILVLVVFFLIIGGFFYLKKEKTTQDDLRNHENLFQFDETKFNSINNDRIYLDTNFTEITNEFNENLQHIIKLTSKKLFNRSRLSKTNESLNYIDLELVYLWNYLNRTLPLFLKNVTILNKYNDDESYQTVDFLSYLTKSFAILFSIFISSYLTLKLVHKHDETVKKPAFIIRKESFSQTNDQPQPTIITSSTLTITNTIDTEEEILKQKLLKSINDDSTSTILNWLLFLGIQNYLNKFETNKPTTVTGNNLLNKLIQNHFKVSEAVFEFFLKNECNLLRRKRNFCSILIN
jgi:hypothetical protein